MTNLETMPTRTKTECYHTPKKGKGMLKKKIILNRKNMDRREIIAKFFFP